MPHLQGSGGLHGNGVVTLHLSRMKAARQTSRTLLGTTTTNCCRASGTAKLSDWPATAGSAVRSEEAGPETLTLIGSFRHTSANRVTPETGSSLVESRVSGAEGRGRTGLTWSQRGGQQNVLPGRAAGVQAVQDDRQVLLKAQIQDPAGGEKNRF